MIELPIPTETWISVFNLLDREFLAKLFDKHSDRQFCELIDDSLNVYDKNVELGHMLLDDYNQRYWKASILRSYIFYAGFTGWQLAPQPEYDMPENITRFKSVIVTYLDTVNLQFLRAMSPVFTNIYLNIADSKGSHVGSGIEEGIATAVRHILPLVNGVRGLRCFNFQQLIFFRDQFPDMLFGASCLYYYHKEPFTSPEELELLSNWLNTQRTDGQPRTLLLFGNIKFMPLYNKLQEHFVNARSPVSFFVRIMLLLEANDQILNPKATNIQNTTTREGFIMKEPVAGAGPDAVVQRFLMARVPNRMSKKELDEKLGELLKFRYGEQKQAVWLVSPAIGPIDEAKVKEEGEEEEWQSFSSGTTDNESETSLSSS